MIRFEVRRESPDRLKAYLNAIRDRVVAAMRAGMQEAMEKLAAEAVAKMSQAGVTTRTGITAANIAKSPRVSIVAGGEEIKGTVSSWNGAKPMGLWLGKGVNVPAVMAKRLMVFTAPDGKVVFTKKHRAFSTRPRPFLNPALQESKPMIIETIRQHMYEAIR